MAEAANLDEFVGGGSDANSLILTATSSFSSTFSSSDLDTESTTSFLPERSITLGTLIGIAGSVSAMAHDDPSSCPRSGGVNCVNYCAGRTTLSSVGSTTSSQSLTFLHGSRIRGGAKLWSLLPCGTCIGFCYANKGTCKGFCCSNNGNSCIVSSAALPLSSSLGHFLIAERDAERSNNEARVYINIMYEESSGTGHRLGEAAVNPLFDLDLTPATVRTGGTMFSRDSRETRSPPQLFMQSQSTSMEARVMSSLNADDGTFMMQAATVGELTSMPPHADVAPGRTQSPPLKGQKTPCNNVCALGCVSHMWARCRF